MLKRSCDWGVLGENNAFLATEKIPFTELEERLVFVFRWRMQAKGIASRGASMSRALDTVTLAMPLGTRGGDRKRKHFIGTGGTRLAMLCCLYIALFPALLICIAFPSCLGFP